MSDRRRRLFRVKARRAGEVVVDEHVECATIVDAIQIVLEGWRLELTSIVSVKLVTEEVVREELKGGVTLTLTPCALCGGMIEDRRRGEPCRNHSQAPRGA